MSISDSQPGAGALCWYFQDEVGREAMPQARKYQVSLDATPYYHVVSRCVRRAFLCGLDAHSGCSFEHRRDWIVERMKLLANAFAVDICAYAVMSNHFHLVVKVQKQQAVDWSTREVVARWTQIFSTPVLVQRYLSNEMLSESEGQVLSQLVETWRERLYSLSWFMRALNEPIARMANQEDNCTGRFWEGRFTSQALLDERALLTAMAYVDLNPVRAGLAATPEESEYTSIQERIRAWAKQQQARTKESAQCTLQDVLSSLLSFSSPQSETGSLPFSFEDYLDLVDWTGRAIRPGKNGSIPLMEPPILQRLGVDGSRYLCHMKRQDNGFHHMIGCWQKIKKAADIFGVKFFKGQAYAKKLYTNS